MLFAINLVQLADFYIAYVETFDCCKNVFSLHIIE
jgi:hypothetical protein